jgi:hypothetical protein
MGMKDERLRRAEKELRESADEVNQLLSAVEAKAVGMNPGHPVSVHIETFGDDEQGFMEVAVCLGLEKIKDRWRLAQGEGPTDDPMDWCWTPILECSLEDRIRASAHVEKLFEELLKASEERAQEARDAVAKLKNILGSFESEG